MSSVLHPVGPERRGTYWRRRLLAVLVLIVVVVLAVLVVRALGTDDTAAGAPQQLDPDQVASSVMSSGAPSGTPSGTPAASDGATSTGTTTSTGTGGVVEPCAPSALSLTLTSDTTTYGPGRKPKLTLIVGNTSELACSAEVGSGMRTFTVADATGAQVWSTADCETSTASAFTTIDPGTSQSMSVTWSRRTSATGCPDTQVAVPQGEYRVSGTWNGVTAEPLQIALAG